MIDIHFDDIPRIYTYIHEIVYFSQKSQDSKQNYGETDIGINCSLEKPILPGRREYQVGK